MHVLGRLDSAETDGEPVQPKFNVLGDSLGWGTKGLHEPEQIPVEVKPGLDVVSVEIDQRCDEHAQHRTGASRQVRDQPCVRQEPEGDMPKR
jgi:hypothetical protein